MRTYGQYCPLAYALDVVGERWSLLIVRDLGLGPRRYGDLQRGLPGLSSNLLATRLRSLRAAGVVAHRTLPPPSGAEVYELTESGRELLAALEPLVRWGARRLPRDIPCTGTEGADHVGAVPAVTALTLLHAPDAGAGTMTAVLRLEPDVFTLRSAGPGALEVHLGEPTPGQVGPVDLDLRTDQATLMRLVAGQDTVEAARSSGALAVSRGDDRVHEWLARFLPPTAMAGPPRG